MTKVSSTVERSSVSRGRLVAGTAVFLVTIVAGLLYVKWLPYYQKSFLALAHHSIGPSIVSGKVAAPPAAGLAAAWQYALAYYNAIWEALLLALILGATIQVLVPRRWIHRMFSGRDFRSVAIAGTLSLGGMM
jgi:uncharacterized membrane protein YraQ (UPF0718 family)